MSTDVDSDEEYIESDEDREREVVAAREALLIAYAALGQMSGADSRQANAHKVLAAFAAVYERFNRGEVDTQHVVGSALWFRLHDWNPEDDQVIHPYSDAGAVLVAYGIAVHGMSVLATALAPLHDGDIFGEDQADLAMRLMKDRLAE